MSHAHVFFGALVILLNLVLVIVILRKGGEAPRALVGALTGLSHLSLLIVILLGLSMWSQGARPAQGGLAGIHVAAGLTALAAAFLPLLRRRRNAKGSKGTPLATPLVTLLLAAIALGIGFSN